MLKDYFFFGLCNHFWLHQSASLIDTLKGVLTLGRGEEMEGKTSFWANIDPRKMGGGEQLTRREGSGRRFPLPVWVSTEWRQRCLTSSTSCSNFLLPSQSPLIKILNRAVLVTHSELALYYKWCLEGWKTHLMVMVSSTTGSWSPWEALKRPKETERKVGQIGDNCDL